MSEREHLWADLRKAAGIHAGRQVLHDCRVPPAEPYILDEDLAAAAEIAIRLSQPLLLTGDPGTGKTRFAFALAHQLQVPLERCNIRSNTTVSDLFYSVDDLDRFRDAQPGGDGLLPFHYYLTFNGLGRAVLFAGGPQMPLSKVRSRLERPNRRDSSLRIFGHLYPSEDFPPQRRVVVLLDEFDKAPRDTPNDMLNEIAEMAFEIPELGLRVAAPGAPRPIAVITSNSERNLPDPFLRRCIYFDIPFPNDRTLRMIAAQHLDPFRKETDSRLLGEVLSVFTSIRELSLTRRPGTAELLDWIKALLGPPLNLTPAGSLRDAWTVNRSLVWRTTATVIKARDDLKKVEAALIARFGPSDEHELHSG
jgi:MoxR-like ATPase